MKFAFTKFKLPSWKLPKLKLPKLNFKMNIFGKTTRLYRAWKKFLRQIPPSYRHFIQSYPRHFIVIGGEASGKSQLVQKFIDQERDIYSFETSYTADSDVEFYLGQRYILQEISWSLVEDRSILAKKQLTNLWNRLYSYRNPIFVVTFNVPSWKNSDSEKINHYARLMLNKIALLSHLIDRPVEVRIALTHMDQVEGYAEFNRILQMYGSSFDIDLTHYDTTTLQETFKKYEEFLPIVLKNASADDYIKVLNFLKELSDYTYCIDQFVRSLTQKEYEKKILSLEKAYLVSNHESDLGSDIFDCVQDLAPSVYIKRHYLKHQVACATLAVMGIAYLGGYSIYKKQELHDIRMKVALLEKYQKEECLEEILPHIRSLNNFSTSRPLISRLQPIYYSLFNEQIEDFVNYSREYILHPTFRKMVLNNQSEVEMIYFLSLIKATNSNRLGQIISENISEWAEILSLREDFIALYINLANTPYSARVFVDEFNQLSTKTPFTDHTPWFEFFNGVKGVIASPHTLETYLPDLQLQSDKLLDSLAKLEQHPLTNFLCKTLLEDEELKRESHFLPKIQLLQDLRNNNEVLKGMLTMVKDQSLDIPSFSSLNVKDFLNSLDDFLATNRVENSSFHFILGGKRWQFELQTWHDLFTEPKVKRIVEDYIVINRDEGIHVFFKNSPELLDISLSYLGEHFPAFKQNSKIPSYFTASAYEKNIFSVAEKLTKLTHSQLISSEVKSDLSQFIAQAVEDYAREYKNQYENILIGFDVTPTSFVEAQLIIRYMTEPLSYFSHFMDTFRNNLRFPKAESAVLHPMEYHLSELAFIHRIMPEDLDKPGEMHNYQAILKSILRDSRMASNSEKQEDFGAIDHYLTPLARMSLAIITERSTSYQATLEEWMATVEIPSKYQSFFSSPVIWMHELGLRELEQSINKAWNKECAPQLAALFQKFPFNPNGLEYVTVSELEENLHPSGQIWMKVNQIIGGVSVVQGEEWKTALPGQLNINPEIYSTVNLAFHATNILWDHEGNRQPLQFKVQTVPFIGKSEGNRDAVSSYLITTGQTIFNVNQLPKTSTLKINWWSPEEILVGFELLEKGTDIKVLRNLKEEESDWNVFQLLKKGKQNGQHIWCWHIPGVENEDFAIFFEENPWSLLNPTLGGCYDKKS